MKFLDYILKFSFGIALGLVIIFKISPLIFSTANDLKNEVLNEDKLLYLSLECFIPGDYDDVRLRYELSDKRKFMHIYAVRNNDTYNRLTDLLFEKKLIDKKDLKGKLPLNLTDEQLRTLGTVKVKIDEENKDVEKLTINEEYIIGNKPSIIRIGFIYFLGVIGFILGTASLLVTIIMFRNNLNIFYNTGKLPTLPNTVESKKEGLKFLIRWFIGDRK